MSQNNPLSFSPDSNGSLKSGRRSTLPIILTLLLAVIAGVVIWIMSNDGARDRVVAVARNTVSLFKGKRERIVPVGPVYSEQNLLADGEEARLAVEQPGLPEQSLAVPSPLFPTDDEAGTEPSLQADSDLSPLDTIVQPDLAEEPLEQNPTAPSTLPGLDAPAAMASTENESEPPSENAAESALPDTGLSAPEQEHAALPTINETPPVSGRSMRGLVGDETSPSVTPEMASGMDDAVVRPDFISDLAEWMVASYSPPKARGSRGSIGIGVRGANARYAVNMKGLSWAGEDLAGGRQDVLAYAFTPSMLDALYQMYIDRFMQAVARATEAPRGGAKALDAAQVSEMYRLYAGRLRSLAGTMKGVGEVQNLRVRASRIQRATEEMIEANEGYMRAMFAFDEARDSGDEAAIEKARSAMERASNIYQQATYDRNSLRDTLVRAVRANNADARTLGDDNVLYVAQWVDRRLQRNQDALAASSHAATLLSDLAQRFEQAADERH